ncbi:hypothetical protein BJ322DRAFT_1071542 [Thelephora terrestris]|uniref:Uncharacterized protein n=1 Tax=Thelephora terrestris TaxID=56493 RepID=A0A9P6L5K7_9AGAM|nr:hypothetical protein BJ322DRAFT_1071513 [Thelephora terrestris]KAF9783529.1 hypothetical protein BJ322DRAFT_1071542 [Thelephora terrestris]
MNLNSPNASFSIFKDGRLKPGIYRIQNIRSDTYLDIHQHSNEVCCRPKREIEEGRGLWEIMDLGVGYAVKMVEPGKPERFCNPTNGISDGTSLFVSVYPAAWRVEIAGDDIYRGFEYVRFFWGTSKKIWDLPKASSSNPNGLGLTSKVIFWDVGGRYWQTWKLIPVKVEGVVSSPQLLSEILGSGSLPPYVENVPEQSSNRAQPQVECQPQ